MCSALFLIASISSSRCLFAYSLDGDAPECFVASYRRIPFFLWALDSHAELRGPKGAKLGGK